MKGQISSGSIDTSKAGAFAFKRGGNAIDALIAAQLAAHVCEPLLTGFGGAGIGMVRFQGKVYNVDMFTTMPGSIPCLNPDQRKVALDFGTTTQHFVIGEGTIAVPTIPQGLHQLHQRFGRLPLELLAKPAIQLARSGFEVGTACGYLLNLLMPIIKQSDSLSKWFTKSEVPLKQGERCQVPEHENDIHHFIEYGDQFFQHGIYEDFINSLHNSFLSEKDIENYTVIIEKKQLHNKRYRFFLPKYPSIGGRVLKQAVSTRSNSPIAYTHTANLLTKAYQTTINQLTNTIKRNIGQTTHISTIDDEGNCAALTTSLGETSGIVVPDSGVILNNFLGEDDVVHPLLESQVGKRLLTMCTPMIFESSTTNDIWVLGSGGSNRIPGAIFQTLQQLLFGQSLEQAILHPRIHPVFNQQNELASILTEDLGQADIETLQVQFPNVAMKHFPDRNLYFGGVHVVGMQNGKLVGMGDPRRNGYAIGV